MTQNEVRPVTEAGPDGRQATAPLACLGLTLLLLVEGCAPTSSPEAKATQQAKALGALAGLRATPDQALQAELARIVEEGGTPELLAGRDVPAPANVAAGLLELFAGVDRAGLLLLRAESEELFPAGPFTFDPVAREKAIRFRQRYERERIGARLALDRPECRFPIAFEAGPADDLAFLDVVWVCSRLEAFQAAEALTAPDVEAAAESLHYMFRLAECLAAEPHPVTRMQAAFLRTEAFLLLQAIAGSEKFERRHAAMIHQWLSDQLAKWPDDALAWIGERAQGMVLYEAVRCGKLADFLTPEEREQLKEARSLSAVEDAALRNVNADELFYLTAMRRIQESCKKPYHARVSDFEELRRDLHQRRNQADFPLVAGRFLLTDIEKGHIIQARDRANCEAWALALALASGQKPAEPGVNPLTGRPYRVERDGKAILVYDIGTGLDGDNPPWIVPDLASSGGS